MRGVRVNGTTPPTSVRDLLVALVPGEGRAPDTWEHDRLVIDTAGTSVDESFATLLAAIGY